MNPTTARVGCLSSLTAPRPHSKQKVTLPKKKKKKKKKKKEVLDSLKFFKMQLYL